MAPFAAAGLDLTFLSSLSILAIIIWSFKSMPFRLVSASLTDGGRGLALHVLTDPVLDDLDPVSL